MRGLRAVGLGLAAAIVVVLAALAQTQPPQPTFRTEANYVRVDAYPTKDGKPISKSSRTGCSRRSSNSSGS